MKTIFTALSPNAEWDDVRLSLRVLFRPGTWRDASFTQKVEAWFKTFLHIPFAFAFDSGRTCLSEILASQNIKAGDEVLLQAYTCVAVPNPILWSGATPIYVDIDPDFLSMLVDDLERKISPRSRAIIIQHTFGQPAALNRLIEVARRHHLYIIEDCAHALGAQYHGQPVGSFGDASFFSFGRDKVISSVFGGVVCTKDTATADYLFHSQQRYSYPSASWVVQHLFHPVICEVAKRTYSSGIGKGLLTIARKTRLISSPVESQERRGEKASFLFRRFSPALAQLALQQLTKLETFNAHRRHLAELYQRRLLGSRFHLQLCPAKSDPIYLRFAIQHPERIAIMQAAKQQQIFLGDWYTTAIAPTGIDEEKIAYTPCPNAEALAKNTLNLPTDIHITDADAARILEVLQPYL